MKLDPSEVPFKKLKGIKKTNSIKGVRIDADHQYFQYYGRVDFNDPKSVAMPYAGSFIKTRFEGTTLFLRFSEDNYNNGNWIGYIIDDFIQGKFQLEVDSNDKEYLIINDLDDSVHDLTIIRRTDTVDGICAFNGLILDQGKKLHKPEPRPTRKIACYGDSITAGVHSELFGYEGKKDPEIGSELSNGWYSWAAITARMLNADVNINGIGGLAMADGYGYFCLPHRLGLESTYDKLNPIYDQMTPWNFNRFTPHVVVIAIGQNDSSTYPDIAENLNDRQEWKRRYKKILQKLRDYHPEAYIILTTTIMEHDPVWDEVLFEIVDEVADDKITTYKYNRAGVASPGHLRKLEAEEMAQELAAFINTLKDPWQQSRK